MNQLSVRVSRRWIRCIGTRLKRRRLVSGLQCNHSKMSTRAPLSFTLFDIAAIDEAASSSSHSHLAQHFTHTTFVCQPLSFVFAVTQYITALQKIHPERAEQKILPLRINLIGHFSPSLTHIHIHTHILGFRGRVISTIPQVWRSCVHYHLARWHVLYCMAPPRGETLTSV